jgi:ABC-type maltose transport system permease subunit
MIAMLTSMFALIYVMTAGGPGTATTLPEFLIWLEQGKLNRPGYASAISMVLFGLMAILANTPPNVPLLAAGVILAAVPVIAVYLLFQRRIVSGLTVGSVKG